MARVVTHCNGTKVLVDHPEITYNLFGHTEPHWECVGWEWTAVSLMISIGAIIIFSILTAFTMLCLVLVLQERMSPKKRCAIALILMTLVCALSRVISLILEIALHHKESFWTHFIYDVGTPGLGASLLNLVIIILDTTRFGKKRPINFDFQFVMTIYLVHVLVGILKDVTSEMHNEEQTRIILAVYHIMHAVFEYMTAALAWAARRNLKRNLKASRYNANDPMRGRLSMLKTITMLSCLIAFQIGTLSMYEAYRGEIRPINHDEKPRLPWEYITMTAVSHLSEACGCVLVLVAFMNTKRAHNLRRTIGMAIRRSIRFSEHDINPAYENCICLKCCGITQKGKAATTNTSSSGTRFSVTEFTRTERTETMTTAIRKYKSTRSSKS